jgi:iron complex outermembrane receptor protein
MRLNGKAVLFDIRGEVKMGTLFDVRKGVIPAFSGLATAGVSCILALAPAVGAAQGTALEEITVTARKVQESLQDTPVAVTAFTADDLAARGVTSLDEVGRYTPNMSFFASGIAGKSSGQVYIRGVGQFDYLLTTDPGVAIYLDGVYLARALGNILDLVDIERVEVLRGPQGTLYGKNTVGGAINVITRKPAQDLEGNLELKVGSYDRINARGNISGALLPDVLAGKFAFSTRNSDGYGKRPLAGDRAGDDGNYAFQGGLDWTPVSNLNVLVAADYTKVDEKFAHHHTKEINSGALLVGLHNLFAGPLAPLHGVPLLPYDERWLTDNPFRDQSTDSNFKKETIWGISGTITWEVAGLTVKSITGYRDMDSRFGTDPDGSPVRIIDEIDDINQKQISQELQISGLAFDNRLNWVAGVYYLHEESDAFMDVQAHPGLFQALEGLPAAIIPLGPYACPAPFPPFVCLGGAGNPFNSILDISRFANLDQETESYSVYGQGSFEVTNRLSVTYGVRYTHEEKDFTYSLQRQQTGIFLVPQSSVNDSWSDVSHRAGLDFRWTENFMTYFSAAKGFKSGGFNGRGTAAAEIQPYDPEELWAYEIGFKSEWLDRRLRLNAAAFYYDYTDLQFSLSTSDGGIQVILVGNAAAAESKGFELEALALPTDRLQINASIGYLDSEYTEVEPGADITTDHKLIGAPKWTVAAGGQYTMPLPQWGSLILRTDYNYRSRTYFDAVNTASVVQKNYGLLDLRASFETMDQSWALTFGVTNVTDEEYMVMGVGVVDSLGFSSAVIGAPRQWFLQGNYRF